MDENKESNLIEISGTTSYTESTKEQKKQKQALKVMIATTLAGLSIGGIAMFGKKNNDDLSESLSNEVKQEAQADWVQEQQAKYDAEGEGRVLLTNDTTRVKIDPSLLSEEAKQEAQANWAQEQQAKYDAEGEGRVLLTDDTTRVKIDPSLLSEEAIKVAQEMWRKEQQAKYDAEGRIVITNDTTIGDPISVNKNENDILSNVDGVVIEELTKEEEAARRANYQHNCDLEKDQLTNETQPVPTTIGEPISVFKTEDGNVVEYVELKEAAPNKWPGTPEYNIDGQNIFTNAENELEETQGRSR